MSSYLAFSRWVIVFVWLFIFLDCSSYKSILDRKIKSSPDRNVDTLLAPYVSDEIVFGRNCNELKLLTYLKGYFVSKADINYCDIYYLTRDRTLFDKNDIIRFKTTDRELKCNYHSRYSLPSNEMSIILLDLENNQKEVTILLIKKSKIVSILNDTKSVSVERGQRFTLH